MDRIGIADMTLYNYSLGAVTAETGHFGKVPWDGIMGFAQDVGLVTLLSLFRSRR